MKNRFAAVAAALLLAGTSASAHQRDEYLQSTTISIEKDQIQAQMRLTPGVAVFPQIIRTIDADANGVLSAAEQRAYAQRTLGDVSLTVDGEHLPLRLIAWKFAKIEEMKEGLGDIQLTLSANAPRGGSPHKLVFANHHQQRIAAYMVNCLIPHDPDIGVTSQKRNYEQSLYQLDYVQNDVRSVLSYLTWRSGVPEWVYQAALLFAPLALLWRRRLTINESTINLFVRHLNLAKGK